MVTSQGRFLLACALGFVVTAADSGGATRVAEAADDPSLDAYTYSPVGKRDPFRSMFEIDPPKPERLTALQKWNLDELKLIAVVTGTPAPYAMIEDPNGKGHVVRRGSYVGRNFGRVAGIEPNAVMIREEYRSYTGARVFNDVTLTIPEPKLELDDDS